MDQSMHEELHIVLTEISDNIGQVAKELKRSNELKEEEIKKGEGNWTNLKEQFRGQ